MRNQLAHWEDYEVLQHLDRGGLGRVLLVKHKQSGALRVLKQLRHPIQENETSYLRFSREVSTLSKLKHPHVVEMLAHGTAQNRRPFLVMERLSGSSLAECLEGRKRLSTQDCLLLFEQLLAGVQAMHEHGIIHRELTPSNIILEPVGERYQVKLIGFGQALSTGVEERLTPEGMVMGDAEYMSPEQAFGRRADVDIRSDLYACGVMLARCLAGSGPYGNNMKSVFLCMHAKAPPFQLSHLAPDQKFSSHLEAVYRRAVAIDPAERFASAAEMWSSLFPALCTHQDNEAPLRMREASPAKQKTYELDVVDQQSLAAYL